jgi:hypothetical protein
MGAMRQNSFFGQKAITATGVGSGAELLQTDLSTDLLSRLYLESAIAAEFISQEITMPSNPFMLPLTTTRPTFYVGGETGAMPTDSDPGTARPILTASKLIGMSSYSYEAEEDAIIAVLPMIQEQLGSAGADALEYALISGNQIGGLSWDTDCVAQSAPTLFTGMRAYAMNGGLGVSLATGGISTANIGALRKAMGKYGVKPRDLMIITGPRGFNDLVMLPETLSAYQTGAPNTARIMTGDAPSILGIRIVTSARQREDLNATGIYDGVTTTQGSILMVHRPSFLAGVKRGYTVEVWRDTRSQMNNVTASFRRAFMPKETPSATLPAGNGQQPNTSVVCGYGYTA